MICGDISPNPGPLLPACDTHDDVTVHRYESTALHRYRNMVSGQNKRYGMRLHHDVWNHIHHLGIARRRKTHRGSKGRGRARSARDHFEGSQAIEVRITCQQSSNCALLSKLSKQYHVQPVPEAAHIRPNHAVKFVLWNSRSLKARGKATAFCDFVISEKISIAAVTETWLTDSSKDDHTLASIRSTLPNFTFRHLPRIGATGGGLGLLAHKGFSVTLNCNRFSFASFEYMDCTLSGVSGHAMRLIIYYL